MTDDGDLLTPDYWCELLGYEVMDPDGWRGRDARPWTDAITEDEFERRVIQCTLRRPPRPTKPEPEPLLDESDRSREPEPEGDAA